MQAGYCGYVSVYATVQSIRLANMHDTKFNAIKSICGVNRP